MSNCSDDDQYSLPYAFQNRLSDDIHADSFRYQERDYIDNRA